MTMSNDNDRQNVTVKPKPGSLTSAVHPPTNWLTANFACEWFNDAINEVKAGSGVSQRRREIIFSVVFAECYLLEWVRDDVLKYDYERLNKYFPSGCRRGVEKKWSAIPKQLHKDGLLKSVPNLGGQVWCDWTKLVRYRDGLIHATACRPLAASLPAELKPIPDGEILAYMQPGWAISVAVAMIMEFITASGLTPPGWMKVDDE